ncbi:MAG: pH regulation protein F [Nitrosospira sp.]|nr:pH regulation protein F [Nitrosospira sp.]
MTDLGMVLEVFLFINLLVALLKVTRGPTHADRMLAALLFGTTGVALLLLLAHTEGEPALVDIALALAVLAVIAGAAFAQRAWRGKWEGNEHS